VEVYLQGVRKNSTGFKKKAVAMIAPSFNSLCKRAELCYLDYLSSESQELIPEFIIDHINQCQHCQEQVDQLRSALSQTKDYIDSGQEQVSRAIVAMLKLHFAYIGKPVTCEITKPFLPSLLEPSLEIKIPTPITAHLGHCQQCSEDLETIRKLNLSSKQLYRLSQLFGEKPIENDVSCSQAQSAVRAVASIAFQKTDKKVMRHICVCPDCRESLYQYRQMLCNKYVNSETEQKEFPCEETSTTDFFDYVIPYGLDPANDQYAKFRQSLISHLRTCPTCLAKMQQLHKTIFAIAERAESGVATTYHIDESVKSRAVSKPDTYAGFPKKAEVKTEQPVPTIDFGAALKQKVSVMKRPLFRIGIVAAAIILIASALFLNISTAGAITIDQIYKAIEKVKNIHISSFIPDKKEPVQEQWVSRTLNINIIKTEKESVLWDLANRIKKVKHLDSNSVKTTMLFAGMITEIRNTITGSFGLMPFYNISEIPDDAKWNRVDDKSLEITNEVEVYDLTWIEKNYEGHFIFKKWRFFVDLKANLPQRVEFYQKSLADGEYNLKYTRVVKYLDDGEMQKVIKEASL
jgi:hypothetical protein